jgi:ABC-type lipoprotein export system ATPase subunit
MTGQEGKLVVDAVTKLFRAPDGSDLSVLRDVSCTINPGETVAVVGPSGSGKSTLLNIVGTLERPTSGTVSFSGTDVTRLSGMDLARFRSTQVGFVFQDHHLLPQLTALENVLLPTLAEGASGGAEDRAASLLDSVGLAARKLAFPSQMSGGERQRVALARALINGARLLLCDEPTGNLDRQTGSTVVSLLMGMAAEEGVTVLMVTHNAAEAGRFDRCLQLLDSELAPIDIPAIGGPREPG